ncbi:MAG: hypothetical protein ACK4ON_05810, partial [Bacteroidia bacterium]
MTDAGIGRYGYIEKEATTFTKLNSNTYSNIQRLRARFWRGNEFIYNVNSGGCTDANTILSTGNFSAADFGVNWTTGSDVFVSVYATYCTNFESHSGGATGFNERSFKIMDLSNINGNALSSNIKDNGTNNVVMSFDLSAGGSTTNLNRLWVTNSGTAQEVNDIPNNGVKVYYEAITGGAVFDGNESNQILYGDWGGNSTSNNQYGNDALNISIPTAGLRCYIVVSDLNNSFVNGRTVIFNLMNDGMSITPNRDTNFSLMRVDATSATTAIPLVNTTTWNGTAWSFGAPNASLNAIIDGTYTTADHGNFICKDLIVNNARILTVSTGGSVAVNGNFTNSGTTNRYCTGTLAISGTSSGNAVVSTTAPTSLSYTSNTIAYCEDNPITVNSPSFSGSAATSFSVSPDLPDGLS